MKCAIIVPTRYDEIWERFINSVEESTWFPHDVIHVDGNFENFNVPKGYNIGIRDLSDDYDYICFTGDDVIFSQGWLTQLIATFNINPSIGAVGPIGAFGKPSIDYYTDLYKNPLMFSQERLSGFCFVMKRSVFDIVGKWDEQFYYFCDSDYMERIKKVCPILVQNPFVYVHHDNLKRVVANYDLIDDCQQRFETKHGLSLGYKMSDQVRGENIRDHGTDNYGPQSY